jgi:prevent-host-death family protein
MTAPLTITATKLRRDLGAVLDAVRSGTTVHVMRNGRPLCTLIPPADPAGIREGVTGGPLRELPTC